LEDARRDIDPNLVAQMKQRYRAAFPALNADDFALSWAIMAAQRHMRVIGTFARLKLRDNNRTISPHAALGAIWTPVPRIPRWRSQGLARRLRAAAVPAGRGVSVRRQRWCSRRLGTRCARYRSHAQPLVKVAAKR